jgi:hypothetical protein
MTPDPAAARTHHLGGGGCHRRAVALSVEKTGERFTVELAPRSSSHFQRGTGPVRTDRADVAAI